MPAKSATRSPIGSVLAVIETEGADRAAEPVADSQDERPLADGAVQATPEQAEELPVTAVEETPKPARPERSAAQSKGAGTTVEQRPSTSLRTSEGGSKVLASPAVRQRARDLGIDLVAGEDRVATESATPTSTPICSTTAAASPAAAPAPRQDETIKVVGLRRKIAENMAEANRRIQHFTLVEEYDVTALEETRQMMNRDRGSNPKLTLLPFLITALSRGLAEWPMLNATFDDEAMVVTRHGSVQMGVATQTTNGLMVATIRDAQRRSVWELASEILRLSDAARSNKASREELSGATFTVSSLGPWAASPRRRWSIRRKSRSSPSTRSRTRSSRSTTTSKSRKRMNLSLSCDHRVIDGWDAASFMQTLKGYIENPIRLLSA